MLNNVSNDITNALKDVTAWFKDELVKIEFNDVDHHYSQFTEKELNSIKTKKRAVRIFISSVDGFDARADGTREIKLQFTAVVICFTDKDRHIHCMNAAEYIFKSIPGCKFGKPEKFTAPIKSNVVIGDLGTNTKEPLAMWGVSWIQTIKYKKGE